MNQSEYESIKESYWQAFDCELINLKQLNAMLKKLEGNDKTKKENQK
jgi:hypothetical protein